METPCTAGGGAIACDGGRGAKDNKRPPGPQPARLARFNMRERTRRCVARDLEEVLRSVRGCFPEGSGIYVSERSSTDWFGQYTHWKVVAAVRDGMSRLDWQLLLPAVCSAVFGTEEKRMWPDVEDTGGDRAYLMLGSWKREEEQRDREGLGRRSAGSFAEVEAVLGPRDRSALGVV